MFGRFLYTYLVWLCKSRVCVSKDIKEEWKVEAALGLDLSHDGKLSLKLKLPDRQNNASNKSSLDNTSNKWNRRVTG